MSIVMMSKTLLLKACATDGRIPRDWVASGFGARLNQPNAVRANG